MVTSRYSISGGGSAEVQTLTLKIITTCHLCVIDFVLFSKDYDFLRGQLLAGSDRLDHD
jgi:hypothetical protein